MYVSKVQTTAKLLQLIENRHTYEDDDNDNSNTVNSSYRTEFRLRNDLYCVGWGVKLYSLTHRTEYTGQVTLNPSRPTIYNIFGYSHSHRP